MTTGNEPPVPAEPTRPPGQVRSRGRFITTIDHEEMAARAARMRADNPEMTYQQIADAVGYSNKSDAWRAIQKCRQAVIQKAGAELIAAEAAQLDDLFVSALEVLERDHLVVSHGKVVVDADGTPLLDDGPKLAAIREMRQIRESYRRLHGLDQPTQVAVSGAVRYEVVGVDPADLT
ncbi:hypothetical protein [Streptomyces lasiicapitis]|uniref:hypothetical protein n=1 Tax=Streptomyces lasiicapitis TaxID=1923961 RepID=UPI003666C4CF